MDNKLALINSIALMYRAAEYDGDASETVNLVGRIVAGIKISNVGNDIGLATGADIMTGLRDTVYWMIDEGAAKPFDRDALMQRVKVNVVSEQHLTEVIDDLTKPLEDDKTPLDAIHSLENTFRTDMAKLELQDRLKKAYTAMHFGEGKVDYSELNRALVTDLEIIQGGLEGNDNVMDELMERVSVSDVNSITASLVKARSLNTSEGVMRTGWQGVNKMLGQIEGLRRGDFALVAALQHNFKSGMLLHIPRQIAMYNIPFMLNPAKKPLIIHASLENNASDNTMILYKWFKEQETGEEININKDDIDMDEAGRYLQEKLSVNGYHFEFLRFNPSDLTYSKLISVIATFERQGYEIHLFSLDYLNMMSKAGTSGGNDASMIRDLFRRVRNYCNPRGITMLTAHQLSPDAIRLQREGCENFVKEVADKSYYDSAKGISQEVDLEIAITLTRPGDGSTFIEMHRGKHRMPFITPEADKYTVYKFGDVGGLPDDVLGESMALKKVGIGGLGSDTDW